MHLSQTRRGRKRYEITKEQLEHFRSLYFSWEAIAGILQVSVSTLHPRREEFGLRDSSFSDISDDELDQVYRSITGDSSTGLRIPNIGRRRFIGAKMENHRVFTTCRSCWNCLTLENGHSSPKLCTHSQ